MCHNPTFNIDSIWLKGFQMTVCQIIIYLHHLSVSIHPWYCIEANKNGSQSAIQTNMHKLCRIPDNQWSTNLD